MLISEWRKQRNAGVLAGGGPGEKVGKLTAEQAEIARPTRDNAGLSKRLSTTEDALDIMGKAHAYAGDRHRVRVASSLVRSSR